MTDKDNSNTSTSARRSKLMSAREAITRFVADGDVMYSGYTQIPTALVHEVVRQGRSGLTLVGASLGGQANELIVSGCASAVLTGYLGGALRPGPIQDRMNSGALRWDDYSNGAIAMMLMAGAYGLPFVPVKWFLGTDYLKPEYAAHGQAVRGADKWRVIESPFDGEKYVALPAIRPDVTLVHVQRGDEQGNVQGWGAYGDAQWALWAAKKVIVSVEELVPTEVIRRDPNRTLVPGGRVSAVVHEPFGAHPTSLSGFYDYDYSFFAATGWRDDAGFAAYRAEWIDGVEDRAGYLRHLEERFGPDWLDNVRPPEAIEPVAPVSYGFAPQLGWHQGGTR